MSQKVHLDVQVFSCLQKLTEFLEDFTLSESQSYLMEAFRDSYAEQGAT